MRNGGAIKLEMPYPYQAESHAAPSWSVDSGGFQENVCEGTLLRS
jgi:hypothetical protein